MYWRHDTVLVAVGVYPQLKLLICSIQESSHSRPQLGPHLDALHMEDLFLICRPVGLASHVVPQQGIVLRIHLREAC